MDLPILVHGFRHLLRTILVVAIISIIIHTFIIFRIHRLCREDTSTLARLEIVEKLEAGANVLCGAL